MNNLEHGGIDNVVLEFIYQGCCGTSDTRGWEPSLLRNEVS